MTVAADIIHATDVSGAARIPRSDAAGRLFVSFDPLDRRATERLAGLGMSELALDGLDEAERSACERGYIDVVADIGAANRRDGWWANGFSEKNEHVSDFYRKLCFFYCLVKTLGGAPERRARLFLICGDDLYRQVERYCKDAGLSAATVDGGALPRVRAAAGRAARAVLSVGKVFARAAYVAAVHGGGIRRRIRRGGKYYVIRTWFNPRSIEGKTFYDADAFFGPLPAHLMERGRDVLVVGGITGDYRRTTRLMRMRRDPLIVPEEFFLGARDVFRLIQFLLGRSAALSGPALFMGLDVTELCLAEIGGGFSEAGYFRNALRFVMARNLAERVDFDVYLQPFENYAWEKMSILGIRSRRPDARILGFQHAFISRCSFKYFPGRGEMDRMPLPDRIITLGSRTKELLERYGGFTGRMLREGCALRQAYLAGQGPLPRQGHKRVLVVLTMVPRETAAILGFIARAGLTAKDATVVIRCHPSAPRETFMHLIGFDIPDNFVFGSEPDVRDELMRCDAVLYTWTTVCVEALMMGLPVIHLDILAPMRVDPLFECDSFKASVRNPEELRAAIAHFREMSDRAYYDGQRDARAYLDGYFRKVTPDGMARFL